MLAVSAIVPAAGLSSRFGGPNKLLEPWAEGTIVGAVVRTLLACGLPVIVVTGRDAATVAETVRPAISIYNPTFEEGLGASIACGIRAVSEGDGFLIALGDMPGLREDVVRSLMAEYTSPYDILAPAYADDPERPGHPVLFGSSHRAALEALRGDEGARSVLRANPDRLRLIHVPGGLDDIDYPWHG